MRETLDREAWMAQPEEHGRIHVFFSHFATHVAKWTGSHWALAIAATFVVIGLVLFGIARTNIAISIVTLLMVFVLQNTQNRDSAALHLKLDEMVGAEPEARDAIQGVESKSEKEIRELRRASSDGEPAGTRMNRSSESESHG
jgi:low affinity Fe/Cu permease